MALIKTPELDLMTGVATSSGATTSYYGMDVASYYNIGLNFWYSIGSGATGKTYLKLYACNDDSYATNQKFHLMSLQFEPSETAKHLSIPCLDFRNFAIKVVNSTDSSITITATIVGARVS